MSVPNQQVGWSPEDKLLQNISKQFERLIQVASTIAGGGGGGTVTSFSFTNGGGFTGTVTNPTTTPTLSLVLQNASGSQNGQLTSADWTTFNNKQSALSFANLVGTANQVSLSASGTGVLVGSTNITLSIPANAQLSVAKLTNLTSNGFVKTSSGDGTLSIDTNTYIVTGSAWLLASGGTLTGANTVTGTTTNIFKMVFTNLGTTQTDGAGIYLQNQQAAANNAQQISPAITFEGSGWGITGGAPQVVKLIQDILPVQGNNPSITWRLRTSINGAAYADLMTLNSTNLNFPSGVNIQQGGTTRITVDPAAGGAITFTQSAVSSLWTPALTSIVGNYTSLTLNTAFIARDFRGATWTWADGTVPTQIFNYFKAFTANKLTTSATFTDIYNGYFEKSIQGTSVTFTRNWGIGTNGNLQVQGSAFVGAASILPTALLHLAAGTATASTAPLKLTSGTNLTTAEAGAFEYDGTSLFFTRTGTTRESILTSAGGASAPSTSSLTAFTNYYGTGGTIALSTPADWLSVVINGTARKIPAY